MGEPMCSPFLTLIWDIIKKKVIALLAYIIFRI